MALFTGCWQKSVQPFYKTADVRFDGKLLGTWKEVKEGSEKSMIWIITKGESPESYRVKIEDDETKLDYDAHLFQLGADRLLDLHSRSRSIAEIPAHNLFRILDIGGTLKAEILNLGWVEEFLEKHPNEVAHLRLHDPEHPNDRDKGETVLTDSTDAIQKFIRAHSKDEKFWSDAVEFKMLPEK